MQEPLGEMPFRSCDTLLKATWIGKTTVEESKKHSFFYDWGSATNHRSEIRSQEIVARSKWFINMRWLAVLACALGATVAMLDEVPAKINPLDFVYTAAFLAITNLAYIAIGRNRFGDKERGRELQFLMVGQMLGDFTALSYLTYALGSIETPMATVFMAHIILATLLFSRWQSLAIACAAWFYAVLPLVMESGGIVPVRSIFDGTFKSIANASFQVTFGFVLATGCVFLFCWYLVSEIAMSLKLREHQLEDAHHLLVKIDKEKTHATLLATHELKAPFAAIKSYVYTLRDGYCGPLPEKAQSVIARIGERCDQLTNRITDIIHVSNLRTLVVQNMNLAPVDLIAVLSEEAREGKLIGDAKGVPVVNLAENNPPIYIMGSASHLKSLFSNLIRNAVCYSYENTGRVAISAEPLRRKVAVKIRDEGIGIPSGNLNKIFEDHFRSKNAVAHFADGTGLGLSIVKEVVVLHGASIEVESTVGKGSCFTVHFDIIEPK